MADAPNNSSNSVQIVGRCQPFKAGLRNSANPRKIIGDNGCTKLELLTVSWDQFKGESRRLKYYVVNYNGPYNEHPPYEQSLCVNRKGVTHYRGTTVLK